MLERNSNYYFNLDGLGKETQYQFILLLCRTIQTKVYEYRLQWGVIVSMLALSAGYHGFDPRSVQTKDYKTSMFRFFR